MNFNGMFQNKKSYSSYDKTFEYNKKQTSVLNTSMFTASIGFLSIFAIGFLSQYMLENSTSYFQVETLNLISTFGIMIGFVLSLVWAFRVYKASTLFALTTVTLYCVSYGIGFGFLFYSLNQKEVLYIFAMVGAIFFGTFLVSKTLSIKAAMKLSKMLWIASLVAMVSYLFLSMFMFFSFYRSFTTNYAIFLVTTGISGVLSVLYLVWSLWMAQNMDSFMQDSEMSKKLGLFIGFQILMNLVQLVILIARMFLIFGNRR